MVCAPIFKKVLTRESMSNFGVLIQSDLDEEISVATMIMSLVWVWFGFSSTSTSTFRLCASAAACDPSRVLLITSCLAVVVFVGPCQQGAWLLLLSMALDDTTNAAHREVSLARIAGSL